MRVVFWISASLIAYTYVGYMAWLALRRRWRSLPVQRESYTPSVTAVLVVHNEADRISERLDNILASNYPEAQFEIVVVSDGSTDNTGEILEKWSRQPRVSSVSNAVARGKAAGLNDAFARARGEIVFFTDVRQKLEPDCLQLLMQNFADPEVGCASGELMLGDPDSGEASRGVGLYWRIEKRIRELESLSGSVIGATGAVYAVRRRLLTAIPAGTILDDVYIPMQVVRQGKRVIFDSRAHAWDVADQGTRREFARKVRTLSGNYQLLQLLPWLLSGTNPVRFELISHKLLRLLVPLALLGTLASCMFLPAPFYRFVLLVQITFYALSLLAPTKLRLGTLTRAADAAFTFVVLNTAAFVAFLNFISGRKAVWTR